MEKDTIRVLCVEDEAYDRELIRDALEKESTNFVMIEAGNRKAFESRLAEEDFDVVLTDFNILGFEGFKVIRSVRSQRPGTPVIVVTGTGSEEVAVQSLREGADDYVIKTPKHIAQLPMTVLRVLETRRAQEELRERDVNFRSLVANAADGILVVDQEGDILFANPAAEVLLGQPSGGLIGLVLGVPMVGKPTSEIDLPKNAGGLGTAEMRVAETVWNHLPAYVVSLRNITERKEMEKALETSEEKYRRLVDALNEGIWQIDAGGNTSYVNPKMAEMLGYTVEEMDGAPFFSFMDDEWVEAARVKLESRKQGISEQHEFAFKKKNGEAAYMLLNTSPIFDAQGRFEGALASMIDITQRKQAEAERETLRAQLLQAQKMESVGRLAGGVAHDFNNKLSVIMGRTEMLLMDMAPEDALHGDLKEIHDAAKRSRDLTRQLLGFARKQTIAPRVLHLNDTVERMLKMLRRLMGEDIDLAWQPDTDLWRVNMDPAQIDQILANLCVNARDAIKGVGKVTIETQNVHLDAAYCDAHAGFSPGDYVMLAISDDGSGMDGETLAHVFEPFFTTKGIGEGTGLGLSTVYGIVKQNHGFINAYSEPDQGSTFRIYLPRHTGEAGEDIQVAGKEMPCGHGETVLIVEDDASVLRLSQQILDRAGYAVLAAEGPSKAMEMVWSHKGDIHVLITDVVMPEMNGRDLAAEIQKVRPKIKTLFMSGYTANAVAHHGVLEEGVHFIQKPFGPDSLALKVRDLLSEKHKA